MSAVRDAPEMSLTKRTAFGVMTIVMLGATVATEALASGGRPLLTFAIAVTGGVYWVVGAMVYLYRPKHESLAELLLNVVALMVVLSTLIAAAHGWAWSVVLSQATAVSIAPLLVRAYLRIFPDGTYARRFRLLTRGADVVAAAGLAAIAACTAMGGVDLRARVVSVAVSLGLVLAGVVLTIMIVNAKRLGAQVQIAIIGVGTLVQVVVMALLSTLATGAGVDWLWVLGTLVLPLTVIVSVMRGDVIVIELRRSFLHLVIVGGAAALYIAAMVSAERALDDGAPALPIMIIAVLSLAFFPVVFGLLDLTDRVVYRDRYSFRGVLATMAATIPLMRDADELARYVTRSLTRSLNLDGCAFVSFTSGTAATLAMTGVLDTDGSEALGTRARRIPLQLGDQQLGEIVIVTKRGKMRRRPADNDLLRTVGHHSAVMLDNFSLVTSLADRLSRLEALEADRLTLHRRLSASEQDARAHLSRELHDSALQSLLHLVRVSESEPAGGARAAQTLADVATLGRDIAFELRQICADLRPAELDGRSIDDAIAAVVQRYRDQYALDVTLDLEGRTDYAAPADPMIDTVVYRVVNESLSNVLRHADAASARVSLRQGPDRIEITVSDDGVGFSVDEEELGGLVAQDHLGVAGIFERVRELHGTTRIRRVKTGGTIMSVTLPRSGATPT